MDSNNRTVDLHIRITASEYNSIKNNASNFCSISHYVRTAINEFSNVDAKSRIDLLTRLHDYYTKYHSIFYHTSANLNQAMKRANELYNSGSFSSEILLSEVIPTIYKANTLLLDMRKELASIYTKATTL